MIDGDLVFTVGVSGELHCLNLKTGDLVWKTNLDKKYGPAAQMLVKVAKGKKYQGSKVRERAEKKLGQVEKVL